MKEMLPVNIGGENEIFSLLSLVSLGRRNSGTLILFRKFRISSFEGEWRPKREVWSAL